MRFRSYLIVVFSLLGAGQGAFVSADISTIAVTGADAPGVVGAKFADVELGPLNERGQIAFRASLEQGMGGVGSSNDEAVWRFDGATTSLVVRTGSGGVADLLGANFLMLQAPAIDDAGGVAFKSELEIGPGGVVADTANGVWRYATSGSAIVAQTGTANVPDVPDAEFLNLSATALSGSGTTILSATMDPGIGGVISSNNGGVWIYSDASSALVLRESFSGAPGVPAATFKVFGDRSVNNTDQFALFATVQGLGVNASNVAGIWRYTGASGELLARWGVGNVPGVAGANFTALGQPVLNDGGKVVVDGMLDTALGSRGVWLYDNTGGAVGTLVARTESGGVPDLPGANFEQFDSPQLNNADQMLFGAALELGVAGVAAGDQHGLWRFDNMPTLVARSGSGNVPDLPGASFAMFSNYTLNNNGQMAIDAQLEIGAGGVDNTNDQGIWLLDPQGDSQLVARSGDLLAGQTIASLALLGSAGPGDGKSNGFNDQGQLAFQAVFTNGDSGLFLFSHFTGDFDDDGDVDSDDLGDWQSSFGLNNGADADGDNDTDGADFLAWQQQFGSPGVPLAYSSSKRTREVEASRAVPEPTALWLILAGIAQLTCLWQAARA